MKKFAATMSVLALLSTVLDTNSAAADEPAAEDIARRPGAYLLTNANGDRALVYARSDGVEYSAPYRRHFGRWMIRNGKACLHPTGTDAPFCYTSGKIDEDGTWIDKTDAGKIVRRLRLDKLVTDASAQNEAGIYVLVLSDGQTGLNVWTSDGRSFYAASPVRGRWHVVDGKRCHRLESGETEKCDRFGKGAADGSFQISSDGGEVSTMTPLL